MMCQSRRKGGLSHDILQRISSPSHLLIWRGSNWELLETSLFPWLTLIRTVCILLLDLVVTLAKFLLVFISLLRRHPSNLFSFTTALLRAFTWHLFIMSFLADSDLLLLSDWKTCLLTWLDKPHGQTQLYNHFRSTSVISTHVCMLNIFLGSIVASLWRLIGYIKQINKNKTRIDFRLVQHKNIQCILERYTYLWDLCWVAWWSRWTLDD